MSSSTVDLPPPGSTSVRFGAAFLRPAKERDHYELMRPILTVTNEADRVTETQHPEPIGPLAVYRKFRRGDVPPEVGFGGPPPTMMTSEGGQPVKLLLAWWPGAD